MNIIDMAGNNKYKNIILGLLRAILLFSFVLNEYNQKKKSRLGWRTTTEKNQNEKRKTKKSKTKKIKQKLIIKSLLSVHWHFFNRSINQSIDFGICYYRVWQKKKKEEKKLYRCIFWFCRCCCLVIVRIFEPNRFMMNMMIQQSPTNLSNVLNV